MFRNTVNSVLNTIRDLLTIESVEEKSFSKRLKEKGIKIENLPDFCIDFITCDVINDPIMLKKDRRHTLDRQSFERWQKEQKIHPGQLVNPFNNAVLVESDIEPNLERKELIDKVVRRLVLIEDKKAAILELKNKLPKQLLESGCAPDAIENRISAIVFDAEYEIADLLEDYIKMVTDIIDKEDRAEHDKQVCINEASVEKNQFMESTYKKLLEKQPIRTPQEEIQELADAIQQSKKEAIAKGIIPGPIKFPITGFKCILSPSNVTYLRFYQPRRREQAATAPEPAPELHLN